MKKEHKFELLQNAHKTLSALSEIYTELAEVFMTESDRENSEMFLNKTDVVIEEMRLINKITATAFNLK